MKQSCHPHIAVELRRLLRRVRELEAEQELLSLELDVLGMTLDDLGDRTGALLTATYHRQLKTKIVHLHAHPRFAANS